MENINKHIRCSTNIIIDRVSLSLLVFVVFGDSGNSDWNCIWIILFHCHWNWKVFQKGISCKLKRNYLKLVDVDMDSFNETLMYN